MTDDAKGYTHFYDPDGHHVADYPATPSHPQRRRADLKVALRKAGLQVPRPARRSVEHGAGRSDACGLSRSATT
ncbi:MAG: hypothetical protein ACR2KG_07570 [Nocardioidaceae bacterium]